MSLGQKEQSMSLGQIIAAELKQEAISTRKMLERIPADKLAWKPHEKSMTIEQLAGHIVNMVSWTSVTLKQDELDFAKMDYKPRAYTDASQLTEDFDKNLAESLETLAGTSDETMATSWTMRNGEQIFFTMPKAVTMRTFVMNHVIHHRGQLSVYLRLLDIPLPSIYGPSADEGM
ncbi:MAG TPA: DinB family protein [Pyrinomonadaceae bacterium]|jgi:uncharacterized damage-inducible protein DinB